MKASYRWIQEIVELPEGMTPERLGEALTNGGIPVEAFEKLSPGISGVVVARVLDVIQHPNADKLRICSVDTGDGEPLQIVCGAANVAAGVKVPCAKIGAAVFDRHSGEKFSIKKSKLRGVESHGMLCSADELGLDSKLLPKGAGEGLLLLPEDAPVGEEIARYMGLDDITLELELTPNRSDCLSMRGVAHEIAAVLNIPNRFYQAASTTGTDVGLSASDLKVEIQSDACQVYFAQVLEDVKVGPSPIWLQMRLAAEGIRSINNVVDVTNLVMLEWGQPLHAFDYDQVQGGLIRVRMAGEGEELVTLDGQSRKLASTMQVIADQNRAIGIAGVMGGENSEVRDATTKIVLESASFDPRVTRRTGKALGLSSEAQKRFEKGVDPTAVQTALHRAVDLLKQLAGATVSTSPVSQQLSSTDPLSLSIDLGRMNRVLGTDIAKKEVLSILKRLEFEAVEKSDQVLLVTIPARRSDITIEEDLYEEVARLSGYDQIPMTFLQGGVTQGHLTRGQKIRRKLRHLGSSLGLSEVWTYTLTHPKWLEEMGVAEGDPLRDQVALLSPMSDERQVLRTALLPSLIEVLQHNLSRKHTDLAIFEIGKTYHPSNPLPIEKWSFSLLISGTLSMRHALEPKKPVDFFTVKGMVQTILERMGIEGVRYVRSDKPWLHPGRSARILVKGSEIGYLGELHPETADRWEVPETYYAELDLRAIFEFANLELQVEPLPRFPASERDLAVLLPIGTPIGDVMDTIREAGASDLESVALFDIYQGAQVPEGKKSAAFSLIYRRSDRTLTDEEVSKQHDRIVSSIAEQYGAELRK